MTSLPAPGAAAQITSFLQQHPWWSACWDKRYAVWRVAEDDPDSALYAESADAAEVLRYMTDVPRFSPRFPRLLAAGLLIFRQGGQHQFAGLYADLLHLGQQVP